MKAIEALYLNNDGLQASFCISGTVELEGIDCTVSEIFFDAERRAFTVMLGKKEKITYVRKAEDGGLFWTIIKLENDVSKTGVRIAPEFIREVQISGGLKMPLLDYMRDCVGIAVSGGEDDAGG